MSERLSVDDLRQLLRLEAETGRLFWRPRTAEMFPGNRFSPESNARRWNTRRAGAEALNAISSTGYRYGMIFGVNYKAHRVVFALYNWIWPRAYVDHIDGDKINNLPGNLRAASKRQNNYNQASCRGSSRFKGVHWDTSINRWRATGALPNGPKYIGAFVNEEDAARAYDDFARQHHGAFARMNLEQT